MSNADVNTEKLKRAVLEKKLKEQLKKRQQASIKKADRHTPLPLSFAQQRMWFLAQFDPSASRAYHIPVVVKLSGQLNLPALTTALDELVARQESLRTRFTLVEGQPCQQIAPHDMGFALTHQDLRHLDSAARKHRVNELAECEARTSFDLTTGPLIRGRLLQLTDEEHILLCTQHHIISDGWSSGVMIHELAALYQAALSHSDARLPPLPVQYADYAVWQRNWLQGDVLKTQRDFWRAQLEGSPALLALPTDRPRPAIQSYAGSEVPFHLDTHEVAALKALGQQHGTTLFMTLLAAWSVVLSRLSHQQDIVIGTPVANRRHAETEALIGLFVNTLALRVEPARCDSVTGLLAQVRERTLAAWAHQDLPFEQVVEVLQPERSTGYNPIFQVMLVLHNTPDQALTLPGLELSQVEQPLSSTQFDLTLSLNESRDGLSGRLEYATDLFDRPFVERMAGYLKNVLAAMVIDATQAVLSLPMLPDAERQRLLRDFNATDADFPREALIHHLFEQQAERTPQATAVVFEAENLSYVELNRRANRLAHHLLALGVQPDDRVAVCAERSTEMVVALLATLKAGGAYVPLDPSYPPERLAYMLEDAAPVALLSQSHLAETLNGSLPVILLDVPSAAPLTESNPEVPGLTSAHLAYVIYTSGTTGQPKGVMNSHQALCNRLVWMQDAYHLTPDDRVLQKTPFSFDVSVWEFFWPLLFGARLVMARPEGHKDASYLAGLIESCGITTLHFVPSMLQQFIQTVSPQCVCPSLKRVMCSGEALPYELQQRFFARFDSELHNLYGPTEAAIDVTSWVCQRDEKRLFVPIGHPIANIRIYILDARGELVPQGVAGEIHIGGVGVARGYLNRPELTAERFIADPFSTAPQGRLYRTGDLGRWLSDGSIEYLGRNDFQLKLRGFRIEPGEIEARLVHCDGVRDAVVIAREDTPGDRRLVAYLRPQPGAQPEPAALRRQLAAELADYMIPAAFVTLDAFPLTPNGKLDRKALPVPDQAAVVARRYEAPEGETEIALATIWQALLGLERVGRHDHFFELGGHSLLAVTLIERLRQQGHSLDVRSIFSAPVLTDMARAMQDRQDEDGFVIPPNRIAPGCTAITPDLLPLVTLSQEEINTVTATVPGGAAAVQDIYPLAPLQEGILFHHLMQDHGDTYLMSSLLAFDSRPRLDAFLAALQQVINRHDILRTAFCWQGLSQPVQVVWRHAPLPVSTFMPASPDDVPAQLRAHADPHHRRPDLTRAPLFSADIAHDPASGEWLLALNIHHLLSDRVTQALIADEIREIVQNRGNALPAPVPYRNFIARTLSVPVAVHEAYFRARLGDVNEATVPFGLPDVQNDVGDIAVINLPSEALPAAEIRTQSRRLGVSPGVLFHVAWAMVLAHTSGRDDVVFGSVLLGRLQGATGADRMMGMFINTLPLRLSLADRSVLEIVEDTFRELTALLEHEQAPLTLAQQCSGMVQSVPLFIALLNYRHRQTDGNNVSWEGIHMLTAEERTSYPRTTYQHSCAPMPTRAIVGLISPAPRCSPPISPMTRPAGSGCWR